MQRVESVESVKVWLWGTGTQLLLIHAVGRVETTGWNCAQLVPWFYASAPKDGIHDFDLCALTPQSVAASLPTTLPASIAFNCDFSRYWGTDRPLNGIRIHSRSEPVEYMMDGLEVQSVAVPTGEGMPLPWPFPWDLRTPALFVPAQLHNSFGLTAQDGEIARVRIMPVG